MKRLEEIKKAFSSNYRPYAISDTEIQLVEMGREVIAELERTRLIEDATGPVVSDPLVSAKSVRELKEVLEANPRPED